MSQNFCENDDLPACLPTYMLVHGLTYGVDGIKETTHNFAFPLDFSKKFTNTEMQVHI